MADGIEERGGSGLRASDGLVLVVLGVVGLVVAFWVLSVLAGVIWGLVKLGLIVVLVVGVLWFLVRRHD